MKIYVDKIKSIRKIQKLTIEELAVKMGMCRVTLSSWENRRKFPSEVKVRMLAKALNVPASEISDLENEKQISQIDFAKTVPALVSLIHDNNQRHQEKINSVISCINSLNRELMDSKLIINALLSSLPSICYIKNVELKYVIVNELFLNNLSLNKNFSVLDKTDYNFFPKNEAELNNKEDMDVLITGKSILNREDFIPGSRKKKWGLISKVPVLDFDGKIECIVGSFLDITHRKELEITQRTMIECIASIAEYRTHETGRHIKRIQNYVKELATALKNHPNFSYCLNDDAINILYQSVPLHDIGKIAIPDSILLKPGKLTEEEFSVIKKHSLYGSETIAKYEKTLPNNDFLKSAREIAFSHHEKWDGTGYPKGIKAEEIPISARLMALADVYDALTTNSVYRTALSHIKALEIIKESKGTHFDPDIVEAFVSIESKFESIALQLSDDKNMPAN